MTTRCDLTFFGGGFGILHASVVHVCMHGHFDVCKLNTSSFISATL